ncbi:MAG: hypothetical protein QOH46_2593 [Solirubrobacteraceae bacterium]|nr:hypothetical protein [Solirubrobacteraceae bacterium]
MTCGSIGGISQLVNPQKWGSTRTLVEWAPSGRCDGRVAGRPPRGAGRRRSGARRAPGDRCTCRNPGRRDSRAGRCEAGSLRDDAGASAAGSSSAALGCFFTRARKGRVYSTSNPRPPPSPAICARCSSERPARPGAGPARGGPENRPLLGGACAGKQRHGVRDHASRPSSTGSPGNGGGTGFRATCGSGPAGPRPRTDRYAACAGGCRGA